MTPEEQARALDVLRRIAAQPCEEATIPGEIRCDERMGEGTGWAVTDWCYTCQARAALSAPSTPEKCIGCGVTNTKPGPHHLRGCASWYRPIAPEPPFREFEPYLPAEDGKPELIQDHIFTYGPVPGECWHITHCKEGPDRHRQG